MQTKTKAITGMVAMLVIVSVLFAYPAFAAQSSTTTSASTQIPPASNKANAPNHLARPSGDGFRPDLKVGSTITYTTLSGIYWTPGNRDQNGSASVALEYTVTGVFNRGFSLTLTAGSITLGNTAYALTSGSAELGPHGEFIVGQAAGANGFQFITRINNLGSFGSASYATIHIDLNSGSAEYYLRAMTTVVVA